MMTHCPDCDRSSDLFWNRREFVQTAGVMTAAASLWPAVARAEEPTAKPASETLVKKLYDSLSEKQREELCFDWDYKDDRGILRTHVSNNWHITEKRIGSDFFTKDQKDVIEALFWGLYNPDWHDRIRKQLKDDADGYGKQQSIAIFGKPGTDQFEFVMTGRHLTIRCDGNTTPHAAFGGPIFYGHAAQGFNEEPTHPGNIFWPQALKANALYQMLDGKQRDVALVEKAPPEANVHFQGKAGNKPGIPITELSADQKKHAQEVLATLLEPYRTSDATEVRQCLDKQGGLDQCHLAFYKSGDLGNDGVWDNWRIEGPSFVWYFRGTPHVHVWVNVADDASLKITTRG